MSFTISREFIESIIIDTGLEVAKKQELVNTIWATGVDNNKPSDLINLNQVKQLSEGIAEPATKRKILFIVVAELMLAEPQDTARLNELITTFDSKEQIHFFKMLLTLQAASLFNEESYTAQFEQTGILGRPRTVALIHSLISDTRKHILEHFRYGAHQSQRALLAAQAHAVINETDINTNLKDQIHEQVDNLFEMGIITPINLATSVEAFLPTAQRLKFQFTILAHQMLAHADDTDKLAKLFSAIGIRDRRLFMSMLIRAEAAAIFAEAGVDDYRSSTGILGELTTVELVQALRSQPAKLVKIILFLYTQPFCPRNFRPKSSLPVISENQALSQPPSSTNVNPVLIAKDAVTTVLARVKHQIQQREAITRFCNEFLAPDIRVQHAQFLLSNEIISEAQFLQTWVANYNTLDNKANARGVLYEVITRNDTPFTVASIDKVCKKLPQALTDEVIQGLWDHYAVQLIYKEKMLVAQCNMMGAIPKAYRDKATLSYLNRLARILSKSPSLEYFQTYVRAVLRARGVEGTEAEDTVRRQVSLKALYDLVPNEVYHENALSALVLSSIKNITLEEFDKFIKTFVAGKNAAHELYALTLFVVKNPAYHAVYISNFTSMCLQPHIDQQQDDPQPQGINLPALIFMCEAYYQSLGVKPQQALDNPAQPQPFVIAPSTTSARRFLLAELMCLSGIDWQQTQLTKDQRLKIAIHGLEILLSEMIATIESSSSHANDVLENYSKQCDFLIWLASGEPAGIEDIHSQESALSFISRLKSRERQAGVQISEMLEGRIQRAQDSKGITRQHRNHNLVLMLGRIKHFESSCGQPLVRMTAQNYIDITKLVTSRVVALESNVSALTMSSSRPRALMGNRMEAYQQTLIYFVNIVTCLSYDPEILNSEDASTQIELAHLLDAILKQHQQFVESFIKATPVFNYNQQHVQHLEQLRYYLSQIPTELLVPIYNQLRPESQTALVEAEFSDRLFRGVTNHCILSLDPKSQMLVGYFSNIAQDIDSLTDGKQRYLAKLIIDTLLAKKEYRLELKAAIKKLSPEIKSNLQSCIVNYLNNAMNHNSQDANNLFNNIVIFKRLKALLVGAKIQWQAVNSDDPGLVKLIDARKALIAGDDDAQVETCIQLVEYFRASPERIDCNWLRQCANSLFLSGQNIITYGKFLDHFLIALAKTNDQQLFNMLKDVVAILTPKMANAYLNSDNCSLQSKFLLLSLLQKPAHTDIKLKFPLAPLQDAFRKGRTVDTEHLNTYAKNILSESPNPNSLLLVPKNIECFDNPDDEVAYLLRGRFPGNGHDTTSTDVVVDSTSSPSTGDSQVRTPPPLSP